MAEDIERTRNGGARFDQTGDIATVTAEDNVIQQIVLTILDSVDQRTTRPLQASTLRSLEDRIERAVEDHPYVSELERLSLSVEDDDIVVDIRTSSAGLEETLSNL